MQHEPVSDLKTFRRELNKRIEGLWIVCGLRKSRLLIKRYFMLLLFFTQIKGRSSNDCYLRFFSILFYLFYLFE